MVLDGHRDHHECHGHRYEGLKDSHQGYKVKCATNNSYGQELVQEDNESGHRVLQYDEDFLDIQLVPRRALNVVDMVNMSEDKVKARVDNMLVMGVKSTHEHVGSVRVRSQHPNCVHHGVKSVHKQRWLFRMAAEGVHTLVNSVDSNFHKVVE